MTQTFTANPDVTPPVPAPGRGGLERGARLGPYELLVPIASGGMGHVWSAVRLGEFGFRRLVAIKVMREEIAAVPEFRRMFLDEARLASRVLHTNVIEVLDLGEVDSITYQVMAFVDGDSLAHLVESGRARGRFVPPEIAARVVCDALRGLHAAHSLADEACPLGFVHRDVSPHNILVGLDGTAKITDFGIAKATGAWERHLGTKGKPAYMAPEQRRGEDVDRRADIFAAGVVLWELLAGTRMVIGVDEVGRFSCMHPQRMRPGAHEQLGDIAMRALMFSPDARFPTAEVMADAIEHAAHDTGLVLSAKAVAAWTSELARDRILGKKRDSEEQLARSQLGLTQVIPQPVAPAPTATPRRARASWILALAAAAVTALGGSVTFAWHAARSATSRAPTVSSNIVLPAEVPEPDVTERPDDVVGAAVPLSVPVALSSTPGVGGTTKPPPRAARPTPATAPPAATARTTAPTATPEKQYPKFDNPYAR
jgi:serine/threonine-protein kinase